MSSAWFGRALAVCTCSALLAAPVLDFSHSLISHTHTHQSEHALHTVIDHGLLASSVREMGALLLLACVFLGLRTQYHYARPHTRLVGETALAHALRRGVLLYRRFG